MGVQQMRGETAVVLSDDSGGGNTHSINKPDQLKPQRSGIVRIRLAKSPEDLRAMALMGADAVKESPTLSRFSYDSERMWAKAWDKFQNDPKRYGLLLAERDGKVTGMLAAQVGPHLFVDALAAQCLVFYVKPEHRSGMTAAKLIKGYWRWTEQLGCDTVAIHVTTGTRMETTGRMLRKMGFAQVGGNYERVL